MAKERTTTVGLGGWILAASLVLGACGGDEGDGGGEPSPSTGGATGSSGGVGGGGPSTGGDGSGGLGTTGGDSGSGGVTPTGGSGADPGTGGAGVEPCVPASTDGLAFTGSCSYADSCSDQYDTLMGAEVLQQVCESQEGTWSATEHCVPGDWALRCTQEIMGGVYIQYMAVGGLCLLGCEETL